MPVRTVTFSCPICKLTHVGDTVVNRRATCSGQTIIFDDDYRPWTYADIAASKQDNPERASQYA
jgi:hypothetical protein